MSGQSAKSLPISKTSMTSLVWYTTIGRFLQDGFTNFDSNFHTTGGFELCWHNEYTPKRRENWLVILIQSYLGRQTRVPSPALQFGLCQTNAFSMENY